MASVDYHGRYKKLFPGVLSSNSFLTVYILHLLDKTTRMYGKEIVDSISARLHGSWEPSHGLVYPILRKLEEAGLIQGYWADIDKKTKRFYSITDLGRSALQDEARKARPMFEEAKQMLEYAMNDLYQKATV